LNLKNLFEKCSQDISQGTPGTPASSTTKTGRHDIAEILLKVALNTKIQIQEIRWLILGQHPKFLIFQKGKQSKQN
jgi:hypothetical protein